MKVGQIGSMSVDINVNKRIVIVSVADSRFEFEAETESEAYDMQEEYVGFLQAFIEILLRAFIKKKKADSLRDDLPGTISPGRSPRDDLPGTISPGRSPRDDLPGTMKIKSKGGK